MILYLLTSLFIGYEIQKLIQFNFFFRIKSLTTDYPQIIKRIKTVAYINIIKISIVDLFYFIVVFIGLFTINSFFYAGILALSVILVLLFKWVKNNILRKIFSILDILLSTIFLTLSVINHFAFNMNGFEFIKYLFGKI